MPSFALNHAHENVVRNSQTISRCLVIVRENPLFFYQVRFSEAQGCVRAETVKCMLLLGQDGAGIYYLCFIDEIKEAQKSCGTF